MAIVESPLNRSVAVAVLSTLLFSGARAQESSAALPASRPSVGGETPAVVQVQDSKAEAAKEIDRLLQRWNVDPSKPADVAVGLVKIECSMFGLDALRGPLPAEQLARLNLGMQTRRDSIFGRDPALDEARRWATAVGTGKRLSASFDNQPYVSKEAAECAGSFKIAFEQIGPNPRPDQEPFNVKDLRMLDNWRELTAVALVNKQLLVSEGLKTAQGDERQKLVAEFVALERAVVIVTRTKVTFTLTNLFEKYVPAFRVKPALD